MRTLIHRILKYNICYHKGEREIKKYNREVVVASKKVNVVVLAFSGQKKSRVMKSLYRLTFFPFFMCLHAFLKTEIESNRFHFCFRSINNCS